MSRFLPFYHSNSLKNQNLKKKKKRPGDIILHKCTKNYDHMLYSSWDMARDLCNSYFSFWPFFFCPLTAQKTKISKKWKKSLEIDIIILHVPKIMIRWCTVPEIWCATDGGQTDKQKKWHIEAGAPPKNCKNKETYFLESKSFNIVFSTAYFNSGKSSHTYLNNSITSFIQNSISEI